jgi:hypothetical protein
MAWSPRGLPLEQHSEAGTHSGSALKLAAMLCKRVYIQSRETDKALKASFRSLQVQGEVLLEKDGPGPSEWSRSALDPGIPVEFRARRERNIRSLLAMVGTSCVARLLFDTWPAGHVPLAPVLEFSRAEDRDRTRAELIAAGIYPPVHWPISHDVSPRASDLAHRLMTIPVDHRCSHAQIERVATMIHRGGPKPAQG